jgi:hypothetical protein
MFSSCKLGLKPHDQKRVDAHVKLTPANAGLDPLVSRTPRDWALGRAWDDDVLANDILGDCGPAACVNWLKMMAAQTRADLSFTAGDAQMAYRAMGWDGTPATDNGVVLMDLLQWWTENEIGGVKLDCFFVIGYLDPLHLATAMQIAPLIVGAELTTACQNSDTWDAKAASVPDVWGGHAYLYHADSPGGGSGKSWGLPVYTSPAFRAARWRECYLPICQELMTPGTDVLRLLNIAKGL